MTARRTKITKTAASIVTVTVATRAVVLKEVKNLRD